MLYVPMGSSRPQPSHLTALLPGFSFRNQAISIRRAFLRAVGVADRVYNLKIHQITPINHHSVRRLIVVTYVRTDSRYSLAAFPV
jgi:hypothetical protein